MLLIGRLFRWPARPPCPMRNHSKASVDGLHQAAGQCFAGHHLGGAWSPDCSTRFGCMTVYAYDGKPERKHERKIGRTITLNYHEGTLRDARKRQGTAEYREKYRERPKVERKIAELMGHGLRQARYVGRKKKRLQALWTTAAVNLKRLFKLAKGDATRIKVALGTISTGRSAVTMMNA
jgi:Transposase DDE domain